MKKFIHKKNGFSLVEVIIATLIVTILTIVMLPIIKTQSNKTKEYSYYLAYRTVEKIGILLAESVNEGFTTASSIDKDNILNILLPKAFAAPSDNICTPESGYYNKKLSASDGDNMSLSCDEAPCVSSAYTLSVNNKKVCCKKDPASADTKYYFVRVNDTGSDVICKSTNEDLDFNPNLEGGNGGFCPKFSIYNPQNGTCECIVGKGEYNDDGILTSCKAPGIPITSAFDLCTAITSAMGVEENKKNDAGDYINCTNAKNKFTTRQKAIYNAVNKPLKKEATINVMNSILAYGNGVDKGIFHKDKKIDPDIIFTNGVKLWILGDRVASIPGLSFTPLNNKANITSYPKLNVCQFESAKTESDCKGGTYHYCKNERHCYSLQNANLNLSTIENLPDARNCCAMYIPTSAEADVTTISMSGFTVYVDIDGDKGPGVLWNDVYPFYITMSGTVFPAYPMDSSDEKTTRLLGGNSAAYLPTDVYYYDQKNHKKIVEFQSLSFAEAACRAGVISKYTPYCQNLRAPEHPSTATQNTSFGTEVMGACKLYKCYITVKKKNSLI